MLFKYKTTTCSARHDKAPDDICERRGHLNRRMALEAWGRDGTSDIVDAASKEWTREMGKGIRSKPGHRSRFHSIISARMMADGRVSRQIS
jgi:hypothetical protein